MAQIEWDPKTELLQKDTRIAQLEQEIEQLLEKQLDAEGELRFRIKELEEQLAAAARREAAMRRNIRAGDPMLRVDL